MFRFLNDGFSFQAPGGYKVSMRLSTGINRLASTTGYISSFLGAAMLFAKGAQGCDQVGSATYQACYLNPNNDQYMIQTNNLDISNAIQAGFNITAFNCSAIGTSCDFPVDMYCTAAITEMGKFAATLSTYEANDYNNEVGCLNSFMIQTVENVANAYYAQDHSISIMKVAGLAGLAASGTIILAGGVYLACKTVRFFHAQPAPAAQLLQVQIVNLPEVPTEATPIITR